MKFCAVFERLKDYEYWKQSRGELSAFRYDHQIVLKVFRLQTRLDIPYQASAN